MVRPKVILNVFSSVDGKITTAPNRNVSEWTKGFRTIGLVLMELFCERG
ncbi:hypothetical protein [Salirhabdus sp. Marseille-P4669]|nr:hypothetical protein [Salirhabdus sp. Marseille-P4669]